MIVVFFKAYEVLSDPEKKKQYDAMGSTGGGSFGGGGNQQQQHYNYEHFQNFNYNEFFKDFDEAMKRHHDEHNRAHFKAHRENLKRSGFTFDFDDLFDDDFGLGDFGFGHLHGDGDDDDLMGSSFIQESKYRTKYRF